MKKAYRIKKNKEFQAVFRQGKSFANRQLVIYYMTKSDQNHFRIGLSVGKKIGNAVTRNRIKRYLRQAFLDLEPQILSNVDIIIIARKPTKDMTFHEIKRSLIHLLKKQRLFKKIDVWLDYDRTMSQFNATITINMPVVMKESSR